MDVDGAVGDLQVLHQTVGIVDVRLHAVGHQHAVHILPAVGRHSQRRHGGAVLPAGNADDGGLAVARLHHFIHPFQQAGQLHLGVKVHKNAPPCEFLGVIVRHWAEKCKENKRGAARRGRRIDTPVRAPVRNDTLSGMRRIRDDAAQAGLFIRKQKNLPPCSERSFCCVLGERENHFWKGSLYADILLCKYGKTINSA